MYLTLGKVEASKGRNKGILGDMQKLKNTLVKEKFTFKKLDKEIN